MKPIMHKGKRITPEEKLLSVIFGEQILDNIEDRGTYEERMKDLVRSAKELKKRRQEDETSVD